MSSAMEKTKAEALCETDEKKEVDDEELVTPSESGLYSDLKGYVDTWRSVMKSGTGEVEDVLELQKYADKARTAAMEAHKFPFDGKCCADGCSNRAIAKYAEKHAYICPAHRRQDARVLEETLATEKVSEDLANATREFIRVLRMPGEVALAQSKEWSKDKRLAAMRDEYFPAMVYAISTKESLSAEDKERLTDMMINIRYGLNCPLPTVLADAYLRFTLHLIKTPVLTLLAIAACTIFAMGAVAYYFSPPSRRGREVRRVVGFAGVGAGIGTAFGPVGTFAGGLIGGGIGLLAGLF